MKYSNLQKGIKIMDFLRTILGIILPFVPTAIIYYISRNVAELEVSTSLLLSGMILLCTFVLMVKLPDSIKKRKMRVKDPNAANIFFPHGKNNTTGCGGIGCMVIGFIVGIARCISDIEDRGKIKLKDMVFYILFSLFLSFLWSVYYYLAVGDSGSSYTRNSNSSSKSQSDVEYYVSDKLGEIYRDVYNNQYVLEYDYGGVLILKGIDSYEKIKIVDEKMNGIILIDENNNEYSLM